MCDVTNPMDQEGLLVAPGDEVQLEPRGVQPGPTPRPAAATTAITTTAAESPINHRLAVLARIVDFAASTAHSATSAPPGRRSARTLMGRRQSTNARNACNSRGMSEPIGAYQNSVTPWSAA